MLRTTGAPAPSSSQDPVSLRSRSRYDSNTVSMLVSLMPLLQSPLQVLYTRCSSNTYHRALQTSWRGWAVSKAVHSMECIGARLLYWRTLSVGAACLQCAVLLALGGVLPNLELELSLKEPKQQTDSRSCARGGIYSW